jgi:hypothetical protein
VGSHHNLVSENINVLLHKWNGLRQNIEAGTHKVNEQNFVVLDDAENSLVVVASALWSEVNNDSCRGVWLHCANGLTEGEHVALVCLQLELGWQITVVHDIQNSIGLCLNVNFTEVHRLGTQFNIKTKGASLSSKSKLITTGSTYLEVSTSDNVLDLWRVVKGYRVTSVWSEVGALVTQGNRTVLSIIIHTLNSEGSWHWRGVSNSDFFGGDLSN